MWLFKHLSVFLTVAALTGCGFTPALAPDQSGHALQNSIEVMAPSDRNGFDITRRLEERLGQPENIRWTLDYHLTVAEDGLGITPEQVTTRYNIDGVLTYTLKDNTTDSVVAEGKVSNFTSYAATGTTISTQTAQRDARQRLMVILADQLYTRLLLVSDQIAP